MPTIAIRKIIGKQPVTKVSLECPSCEFPLSVTYGNGEAQLPNYCPNCGAALELTASGGEQEPDEQDDQPVEKSAPIDLSTLDRDQLTAMATAVSVAVMKAMPHATATERLAAIEKACPGLLQAQSAGIVQPTSQPVAKQARKHDARATIVKSIESGADQLVAAGKAATKQQAIAMLVRSNPALYAAYRNAGR